MSRKWILILAALGLIVIFREQIADKTHDLAIKVGIIETAMQEVGQVADKQIVPHSSTRIDNMVEVNGKMFNFPKDYFDMIEIGDNIRITYTSDTIQNVEVLQ